MTGKTRERLAADGVLDQLRFLLYDVNPTVHYAALATITLYVRDGGYKRKHGELLTATVCHLLVEDMESKMPKVSEVLCHCTI